MTEEREQYGEYSVDDEDQLDPEDTLVGDDLEEDPLDEEGYEPAEHYSTDYGETPWEEEHRETIDQRAHQGVPDQDPYGRPLVDRSETRPGASAEEAAMHVEES